MKDNPIVSIYNQQTNNLIAQLRLQQRASENIELERTLNQFKHSHEQLLTYMEQLQAVIETAALLTSALNVADVPSPQRWSRRGKRSARQLIMQHGRVVQQAMISQNYCKCS